MDNPAKSAAKHAASFAVGKLECRCAICIHINGIADSAETEEGQVKLPVLGRESGAYLNHYKPLIPSDEEIKERTQMISELDGLKSSLEAALTREAKLEHDMKVNSDAALEQMDLMRAELPELPILREKLEKAEKMVDDRIQGMADAFVKAVHDCTTFETRSRSLQDDVTAAHQEILEKDARIATLLGDNRAMRNQLIGISQHKQYIHEYLTDFLKTVTKILGDNVPTRVKSIKYEAGFIIVATKNGSCSVEEPGEIIRKNVASILDGFFTTIPAITTESKIAKRICETAFEFNVKTGEIRDHKIKACPSWTKKGDLRKVARILVDTNGWKENGDVIVR